MVLEGRASKGARCCEQDHGVEVMGDWSIAGLDKSVNLWMLPNHLIVHVKVECWCFFFPLCLFIQKMLKEGDKSFKNPYEGGIF